MGSNSGQIGTVIVNNYYWDQNKEFVKVYIEVDKDYTLDTNQIQLTFKSKRGFSIVFGKYKFNLSKLFDDIEQEGSYHKLTKSNKLIIYLKKTNSDKEWTSIDERVDKFKDQKDIPDMYGDPKGFMKLMKEMYADGDDETKRAIAKSWYETQQQQHNMGDMGADVMNMDEMKELMK